MYAVKSAHFPAFVAGQADQQEKMDRLKNKYWKGQSTNLFNMHQLFMQPFFDFQNNKTDLLMNDNIMKNENKEFWAKCLLEKTVRGSRTK